mgnify:FL=1
MDFLKQAVRDLIVDDGLVVLSRECGYREVTCFFLLIKNSCLPDLSNTMR